MDRASKLAALMGGSLACITNATENNQVRRVANGELYGLVEYEKAMEMGQDLNIGNGPMVKSGLTNWSERPNNYSERMKTELCFRNWRME